jgi:uncharacterized protein YjbJ (UPF0337 family)
MEPPDTAWTIPRWRWTFARYIHERRSNMNIAINQDILAGKWKQVRGKAKQWWGKLTDNDLDRVSGRFEELVGLVQERYGYTREQAQKEVERFLDQFNTNKS